MATPTTRSRTRVIRSGVALSAVAGGLLLLAACGSGGGTTTSGSPASSAGATGTSQATVTVRDSGGMSVLATSSGRTLYVSDQENGTVLCTSRSCHAVWVPLTVAGHQKPTEAAGVTGPLTTMTLADGARQVAYDGHPLYTFSLDHSAGDVKGNGQSDSFSGTDFTWHAATPTGAAPSPTSGSSSGSSGDSGYGY